MNNLVNKAQKEYIAAKAGWTACKEASVLAEKAFLKNNLQKAESLLRIEDLAEFDRLNEKFCAENACVLKGEMQARDLLIDKERTLIACALSIIPASLADQLRRGLRIAVFRQEAIDLFLQLDGESVPHILRDALVKADQVKREEYGLEAERPKPAA